MSAASIPVARAAEILREDAVWGVAPTRTVQAFGVNWSGPLPVCEGWAHPIPDLEVVAVRPTTAAEISRTFSGTPELLWRGTSDGAHFSAERGVDGDVLLQHSGIGEFLLAAAGPFLTVGVAEGRASLASRSLLDSVMFTVALVRGRRALHGAAVARGSSAVLVVGPTGAGKSTLSASLQRVGWTLVADDVSVVDADAQGVFVFPGPPVTTLPSGAKAEPEAQLLALEDPMEHWTAVPVAPSKRSLAAIVVLGEPDVSASHPLGLITPHLLSIAGEARRERFEFLLELSDRVPVLSITAKSAPPDRLAAIVHERLNAEGIEL